MATYRFVYSEASEGVDRCGSSVNRLEACPGHGQADYDMEGVYSISFNMTFGHCEPGANDTELTVTPDTTRGTIYIHFCNVLYTV